MGMGVLHVPACLCTTFVPCSDGGQKEGGVGSPGTGVPDSCELSRGCRELNLGFLKAQPVLLPIEPSPAPRTGVLKQNRCDAVYGIGEKGWTCFLTIAIAC